MEMEMNSFGHASDSLRFQQHRKRRACLIRTFLDRLSADPALRPSDAPSQGRSLAEWLELAKYPVPPVLRINHDARRYKVTPSHLESGIDVSVLLTLLLRQQRINRTADDLMRHVLEGGSVASFLDHART
ncbi:hypothetical protein IDH44_17255 [Paenibacillus sp. IB182496]|uniref:Uncharacterized protein n=1 Tax=Paenibacillus sabuli TaxID=2772509 RepID=A0A927GSV0_9BACL|nr:hypothetical protein [Paenibacillus sabuli]MBD2846948.1 hypothetical protein [Paenibacillus sabuli]